MTSFRWIYTRIVMRIDYLATISEHIKHIFEEGELEEEVVVRNFRTTTQHGAIEDKTQTREVKYYNLDVIISVGYRVKSHQGTKFRQWATARLREYIVKGFTMNDELLKQAGGGNYFDELLARIRDIRSSEKVFWRKVLDILGLTNFKGDTPTKQELQIAKNYLNEEELNVLNRMVTAYLELAELQALNRKPMYMTGW
ncbi:RhuM family protein [Sphingobacterium arenae]|uniref:Virulence RhuM family protein n=1 Tax=Sphingobacterium arenae TaxID=1280598 RepID=A0ABR7Y301_9SPHI|nr:RhuM family protein [Sphingobacterium arenae]MBD1425688.1 virulence RhuM family protein [Sphingobacterium arenae]